MDSVRVCMCQTESLGVPWGWLSVAVAKWETEKTGSVWWTEGRHAEGSGSWLSDLESDKEAEEEGVRGRTDREVACALVAWLKTTGGLRWRMERRSAGVCREAAPAQRTLLPFPVGPADGCSPFPSCTSRWMNLKWPGSIWQCGCDSRGPVLC